ncbi:MAG: ribonuclease H-like domain-containing protein, partial [Calditrichota bacterium]
MNIRDKLNRLDKSEASAGSNLKVVEENPLWVQDFQRELDAKILQEQNSFIVLKENYYPLYDLNTLENLKMHDFRFSKFHHIAPEIESGELNLRKTIFIDLETTGLSGGTGTFAFLVGLGHIELDHVVVRQYLLPDFQYEWLMLKLVENNFGDFSHLITFNGKSFDVPLLRTRFVMNRMESSLDQLQHIDLLHASRRLWKRRLTSCDLQNLEFAILGQTRVNDIPGEMIPQLYFEYIRKRNANLLRDVLEHNYHDIVNLVLLTIHVAGVVNDPLAVLDEELD